MIKIAHGGASCTINPDGAWVEELRVGERPILFPKTELVSDSGETKARGGMHVCLPNFGPGGDSGLAQHGFGRTMRWGVTRQTPHSVSLQLRGPSPYYAGLEATLDYALEASSLQAALTLHNASHIPLRAAPGFHPYFHLNDADTAVSVNGSVYELLSLGEAVFIHTDRVKLGTTEHTIQVSQQGLSTWAIWTDSLSNYVCVEPTYAGFRFLGPPTPDDGLEPDEQRSFSCTISW